MNAIVSQPPVHDILRKPARWIAAGLLVVFAALAAGSARQHSEVLHEAHYVYAGLQDLRHGVHEIASGTPPGLLQLSALPLLFLDLDDHAGPPAHHPILSERFVHENRRPAATILAAARAPFIALGILLGIVVFVWARALYGDAAGLLALAVYALSPTMLAQTQFAHQDFGVAAACTLAGFAFWRMCASPRRGRALAIAALAGVATGAALLTKFTALALLPTFAVVGVADALLSRQSGTGTGLAERLLELGLLGGVAALVVWADYGFEIASVGEAGGRLAAAHAALAGFSVCPAARQVGDWVVPAPFYVCGLSSQLFHGLELGHVSYLAGERSATGWWSFYLWTLLYKQPVPVLVLLGLRAGSGALRFARGERGGELRFLLAFPALVFVFFSAADAQLGERYILPALPPLFVWIGGLARDFAARPALRWASAGLLLWLAVGTLRVHPHHLMYFNEIAGGPDRGWRMLVSGYDMGQDLGNLERYVDERGIGRIQLACVGCRERRRTLRLQFQPLGCREQPGWVALSVGRSLIPVPGVPEDCYDWLRPHEPVERIGHSILVYRIEPRPRPGRSLPRPGPRPDERSP